MVPTLTCGLVRENTSLAIVPPQIHYFVTPRIGFGAKGGG
jgi:hypothetical protein